MNLQSFRRFIPALAVLVILLVLFALPKLDALFFASGRYEQCTRLATSDAAKALALARAWRADHPGSPMARHCEAIALFAMKDYPHSAEAFLTLGHEARAGNTALSARLLQQAARAYEAAGNLDAAASAVTEAQALEPSSKELKDLSAEIAGKRAKPAPAGSPSATGR
jgi:tetratricopeptide (TPR) repeat protein